MTKQEEFDNYCIEHERRKTKNERYMHFEHTLRYFLCELKDKTDRDDNFLLNDIKQAIIVFSMKNEFEETNEIFLSNMKDDFYNAVEKLEIKHQDITERTTYIKLFMEDFYFNI